MNYDSLMLASAQTLRWMFWVPIVLWPNAIWRYLWTRPWPSARQRWAWVLAPWLALGTAMVLDHMATAYRQRPATIRFLRNIRTAVAGTQDRAHERLDQLVDEYRHFGARTATRVTENRVGHLLIRTTADAALALALASAFSLLALGPLHILFLGAFGQPPTPRTVGSRNLRRGRSWNSNRTQKRALRRRKWLLGRSLTTGKCIEVGEERERHAWIVGGTGTGKTVSALLPSMRADIVAGRAVVMIDGKGDPQNAAFMQQMAIQAGRSRDFKYFNLAHPENSATYSMLIHGTATEKKDKIIAALEWSEPHYKKRAEQTLLHVLSALERLATPYCLDDVRAAITHKAALVRLMEMSKGVARERLQDIKGRWKEVQASTVGLQTDLGLIVDSEFGGLFHTYKPSIDFWHAYRDRQILYIGLPTMMYQETAARIAKLMLSDLKTVASRIQAQLDPSQRRFMSVVIDEFAAFAFDEFSELINKARSARIGLTLAHQSLTGDLQRAGEPFFRQIVANTNLKVCLRQDDPQDAEYFAKLSGTRTVQKRTEQVQRGWVHEHLTGVGSDRSVEEFNISPNLIKELSVAQAAVISSEPRWCDVVQLDGTASTAPGRLRLRSRTIAAEPPPGGVCLARAAQAARRQDSALTTGHDRSPRTQRVGKDYTRIFRETQIREGTSWRQKKRH